jgi:UDP-glucose 4-epimerase
VAEAGRWLVTGGCGFIGRNLIAHLTAASIPVRVLDTLPAERWADLPEVASAEQMVGDIRDPEAVARAMAGCRVAVHLAANSGVPQSVADPLGDCAVNVQGTLTCLEAARRAGVERFVFASSGAPIGECSPPIHEDLPARPISPYGASKLAGEAYCSAYARCYGLETVALRFSNAYGPISANKRSIVAKFITDALAGRDWHINGDGSQTRDFIHVADMAAAIRRAADCPGIGGDLFQIATNSETTIADLADRLARTLARHGITPPAIHYGPTRQGDIRRNFSDITKARTRLDWQARIGLDEGLDRTVRWFAAQPHPAGDDRTP